MLKLSEHIHTPVQDCLWYVHGINGPSGVTEDGMGTGRGLFIRADLAVLA
jgi:hypothetical protein